MVKMQVRITLPAEVRRVVDGVRERWNPEKAAGNPAHATIVYQDEAPDADRLAVRVRAVAAETKPFVLELGTAARFPEPIRGAYLAVSDPTGGVSELRSRLLAPPFTSRSRFGLHVTLLHPDQGDRLESAWPVFAAITQLGAFHVTELQLVGLRNEVLLNVELGGA